jgi:hypothetical protein
MSHKRGREEEVKVEGNPICCLCKKQCECKYGNNPDPVVTIDGARCCDECNMGMVLPARIGMVREVREIETKIMIPGLNLFYVAFGGEEEFDAFMEDGDKRALLEPLKSSFLLEIRFAKKIICEKSGSDFFINKKRRGIETGILPDGTTASIKEHVANANAILDQCRELKKGWTKIPVGGKTPSPTKMTTAEANEIMRKKKADDIARNKRLMDLESEKKRIENELKDKKLTKKLRKQTEKEAKDKDVGGGGGGI